MRVWSVNLRESGQSCLEDFLFFRDDEEKGFKRKQLVSPGGHFFLLQTALVNMVLAQVVPTQHTRTKTKRKEEVNFHRARFEKREQNPLAMKMSPVSNPKFSTNVNYSTVVKNMFLLCANT